MASHEASLELLHIIGFGGTVSNGLKWHPDGHHIVFPLGTMLVIRDMADNSQVFLRGHTDKVTCVALSKCGKYIASGQRAEGITKAPIMLWSFDTALATGGAGEEALLHRMVLHKGAIQALDFSFDSAFLASLGGADDNTLGVWEVESGRAIAGTAAGSHAALAVAWPNRRSDRLFTGGQYHMRAWELNLDRRRLTPEDWKTGSIKRVFSCIAVDDSDSRAYCGTTSGDVLEFNCSNGNFLQASKVRFSLGASCMAYVAGGGAGGGGALLVGTGDGALVRLAAADLSVAKVAELMGAVTSVAPAPDGSMVLAGTAAGNLYSLPVDAFDARLLSTAHAAPINDVVFPEGTAALFITAAGSDIRVWATKKCAEVLRIQVPNLTCLCVAINRDGTCIASGWDDGKVRAFLPESGKLLYVISDAHAEAVTAVAFTNAGDRLVTGGRDGRVRVWSISERLQKMELSFKDHKKEVTCIRVSSNDEEAVSASADGSCLLWSLKRGTRINALFASTIFRAAVYHPDESQLLTCGSDRKLSYWDAVDCTAIRVMDGSTEEINSVDISRDGSMFVSAGLDRQVKLWAYDEGDCLATGVGHSGGITKAKLAPDASIIVSGGDEGAIFIWALPGAAAPVVPAPPLAATAAGAGARAPAAAAGGAAVTSTVSAKALRSVAAPRGKAAAAAPAAAAARGGAGGPRR